MATLPGSPPRHSASAQEVLPPAVKWPWGWGDWGEGRGPESRPTLPRAAHCWLFGTWGPALTPSCCPPPVFARVGNQSVPSPSSCLRPLLSLHLPSRSESVSLSLPSLPPQVQPVTSHLRPPQQHHHCLPASIYPPPCPCPFPAPCSQAPRQTLALLCSRPLCPPGESWLPPAQGLVPSLCVLIGRTCPAQALTTKSSPRA